MRRLSGETSSRSGKSTHVVNENKPLVPLERLPIEVSEVILLRLRPADLVSIAAASPQLEAAVRSPRLWRRTTVNLCGDDVTSPLRQIQLAPQLRELQIGFGALSKAAANAIRRYKGPAPLLHTLRLRLSVLGKELGLFLLERHGPATHLELDLRHGPLEQPRCNRALIERLQCFKSLEYLTVRLDNLSDIIPLIKLKEVNIVEIDIRRLRISDPLENAPGPKVGITAAHLISHHVDHIQALYLPPTFDSHLSASVLSCRRLRSLAINLWTLPAVEQLWELRCLHVFLPDHWMTRNDIVTLANCVHRARAALSKILELRFLQSDIDGELPTQVVSDALKQAVTSLLLAICKRAEVIEIQWELPDCVIGEWSWMDSLLSCNMFNLRELRLGGNVASPRHFVSLARYCPNLEILDVRRSVRVSKPEKWQVRNVTTYGCAGMRRALDLLQGVLSNLTILLDDNAENSYDWSFYLNSSEGDDPESIYGSCARVRPMEDEWASSPTNMDKLFVHLLSLDQWISAGGFQTPRQEDVHFWRCATLDSFLWPAETFCQILGKVPALGLIDCRNREALSPGKRGLHWMKALAFGPLEIRALRIQASLVSAYLWELMERTLRRIGGTLQRLELDFRGRPFREWRDVLSTLGSLPNLTEFVLRGSFDSDKPVLDWLHGQLPSIGRLDLRDCHMATSKQVPAFLESLEKLLIQLRGSLWGLALPPLPRNNAAEVTRTVARLTNLREVAVHVNELLGLRPLKSLSTLEIYGDRRPCKSRPLAPRFAWVMRQMSDELRGVRSLTLPASLFESQLVQEAVYDMMPNLRRLHVISGDRRSKTCVEGPRCRDRSVWKC